MLQLLRQYWPERTRRHDEGIAPLDRWLFPGRETGQHLTIRQLSRLLHEAIAAAGITKCVSLHTLRHSSAPHLLEADTDIRLIQAVLGHDKLDSTARYTRVATGRVAAIKSPITELEAWRQHRRWKADRSSK